VLLDLSRNTILVALVLVNTASVGQSRCVEDADLGKGLRILITFRIVGTYHYIALARKFVKAGRVGLTLIIRAGLLVGAVEDFKVIVVYFFAVENIGDEF